MSDQVPTSPSASLSGTHELSTALGALEFVRAVQLCTRAEQYDEPVVKVCIKRGTVHNAGSESLRSTVKHEYYKRHAFTTCANLTAGLDN